MAKTLILVPIWGPKNFLNGFLPLLVVRQCSKLSLYAISRKNNEPNLKKWQKNLILGPILDHLSQICLAKFFLQVYLYLYVDIVPQAIILCN